MLNVLMAATSYPATHSDWRGRFIYDMAESLANSGRLKLGLWAPPGELPEAVASSLTDEDALWLSHMVNEGGIAHLLRTSPLKGLLAGIGLVRRLRDAYSVFASQATCTAVVHSNWLQTAIPLWGTRLPALITVLGSDLAFLKLPGMTAVLRSVLKGRKAMLAPNALWMVPVLQTKFGDLAEVRPIPFGVHSRWFAIERNAAASTSRDWLMVSRVTRAKLGYMYEWGQGLFGEQRKLHLLGPMQEAIELPSWVVYHGPTNPDSLASEWFPRVQGLLTLSQHDEGRPQVMIEAMAAGLPIVASNLPAHSDLLDQGRLGRLVGSANELRLALEELEVPQFNLNAGEAARKWIIENIGSWDDCAARYVKAYEDLLRDL